MNALRSFLVWVRVFLAFVAVSISAFKLINPESNPIFLSLPDFNNKYLLPWETNPIFARLLVLFMLAISTYVLVGSLWLWVREKTLYGKPLPFAPAPMIGSMFVLAVGSFWYAVIGATAELWWGFAFTSGLIWSILFMYEFSQWGADR